MIKNKIVPSEIMATEDIVCDICKQSCRKHSTTHDNGSNQDSYEYAEIEADWGFFSGKDMTRYTAQICEGCFDKHLVPLIDFHKEDVIPWDN